MISKEELAALAAARAKMTKGEWEPMVAGIEGDNYIAATGPWYKTTWNNEQAGADAEGIAMLVNAADRLIEQAGQYTALAKSLAYDPERRTIDLPDWRARAEAAERECARLRKALGYLKAELVRGRCEYDLDCAHPFSAVPWATIQTIVRAANDLAATEPEVTP